MANSRPLPCGRAVPGPARPDGGERGWTHPRPGRPAVDRPGPAAGDGARCRAARSGPSRLEPAAPGQADRGRHGPADRAGRALDRDGLRRPRRPAGRLGDEPTLWSRWRADPTFAPPGGESLAAVGERVRDACADLADAADGGDVVVISHVSPIKAAIAWALGVDDVVAVADVRRGRRRRAGEDRAAGAGADVLQRGVSTPVSRSTRVSLARPRAAR